MGCPNKVKIILLVWLVSSEGFEPLFFVPPRAQTAVIGTYTKQVVTRVIGYSYCLACD